MEHKDKQRVEHNVEHRADQNRKHRRFCLALRTDKGIQPQCKLNEQRTEEINCEVILRIADHVFTCAKGKQKRSLKGEKNSH